MKKCYICGKDITSGVIVERECLNEYVHLPSLIKLLSHNGCGEAGELLLSIYMSQNNIKE